MDMTPASETDWDRVLAYKEGDAIAFEPGDGPYDPNNAQAAQAWLVNANMIRKDHKEQLESFEADLIHALQANEFAISSEELNGRSLVTVLRKKLGTDRQTQKCSSKL